MGYTTQFSGVLKFANDITVAQLKELKKFLGEDMRDHPEWGDMGDCHYLQFEVSPEMDGLQWDGSEKFYGAVDAVNIITRNMKKQFPDFAFSGELLAQGENIADRWRLVVENGVARKEDNPIKGKVVNCPHCGEDFIIGQDQ